MNNENIACDFIAFQCNPEELQFLKSYTEIQLYKSIGTFLRNHYKLWSIPWEKDLKTVDGIEVDCSINHPDNRSFEISKLIYTKLHEEI